MKPTSSPWPVSRSVVIIVFLSLALGVPLRDAGASEKTPVIEAGREAEIEALVAPLGDGRALEGGWNVTGISVTSGEIAVLLQGPAGEEARVTLVHPSAAPTESPRTASFAVITEGPDSSRPALRHVETAIHANDAGGFWRAEASPPPSAAERAASTIAHHGRSLWRWLQDGALWFLLGLALVLLLVRRETRAAPRKVIWLLLATVAIGAAYRVWMAPWEPMTAWSYNRIVPLAWYVAYGPSLTGVTGPLPLTTIIFGTSLALAVVTPLVLYLHARRLLGDWPAGLAVAALLALYPAHIRFSASDTFFVQSIVVSSLSFAVLHMVLANGLRRWGLLAVVLLPVAAYATYLTRPLNLLFLPLFVYVAFLLGPRGVGWRRRTLATTLVTVPAVASIVTNLLATYAHNVSEGLSWTTLGRGLAALVNPQYNTLVHPRFTPAGLLLLAVVGAVVLWRHGRRRLVVFLLGWLLAFFVTHAYVLPSAPEMQTRYHLHLAVPFLMMAGAGLVAVWRWRPRWAYVAAAYLALAPLVHAPFVRDTAFNMQREFAFLTGLRDRIPDGCTVLEYHGSQETRHHPRLARVGAMVVQGEARARWRVVSAGGPADGEGPEALNAEARALLADPPDCLVVYRGLACLGEKPRATAVAPACTALAQQLTDAEDIAASGFASRVYDENFALGFVPERPWIELHAARVRSALEAPAPPREQVPPRAAPNRDGEEDMP